jgi:hypothetical protein
MGQLELAFKLVNEIDVETTKAAIDKFAAENRDLIRINADRLVRSSTHGGAVPFYMLTLVRTVVNDFYCI